MMKTIIRHALYVILAAGASSPAFGLTPGQLMEEANHAYIEEAYHKAIELYEQILEKDLESPYLYYNLGNAYFQEGMTGKAILNYERALRLKPNDEAIIHNLRIARSQIVDRVEPLPRLFFLDWWHQFVQLQTVDGWAVVTIVSLSLLVLFAALFFVSRRRYMKNLCIGFVLLMLMSVLVSYIAADRQYHMVHEQQEAIVMVPRTVAKSSPGDRGIDLFIVHEGTRVIITNEVREWHEVRLANGNVGWIERSALERI